MRKSSIKVLIVDDDKASGSALGEVVKRLGFKPIVSNRPSEALNIAKLQSVQAAIVDVLLPKMSGVDLAIEFRKTRFADSPVIFVSGVFKDKSFATEAMHKAKAVEFLFKPYSVDELTTAIKNALSEIMDSEKRTVRSLLTHNLSSARERAKAIEQLDTIRGQDFPFVLSILMGAGISGHLNIVNNLGEIFGVSLTGGSIDNVDSTESTATAILALISRGFLSQADWDMMQREGRRNFSLDDFIREGLVSPHAVGEARLEQILHEIQSICTSQTMQLNFVPTDDGEAPSKYAVLIPEMVKSLFAGKSDEIFDLPYLKDFYSAVLDSPMKLNCKPGFFAELWSREPGLSRLEGLRRGVEGGGTLGAVVREESELERELYLGIHRLVLGRVVIFDDIQRAKNLSALMERFQLMYSELKDKSADRVFAYFGVEERLSPTLAEKIYEEYVRSNDPARLPKDAPSELISLARDCLQILTDAKAVIMDDKKREALLQSRKEESSQKVKKSDELTLQGLELLRKGRFKQASEMLEQAGQLHGSNMQYFIKVWADIKAQRLKERVELQSVLKRLEGLPMDDRKSHYYFMAVGLVKKALGDQSAHASFERALQLDESFVEAGREIHSNPPKAAGKDKIDNILTGDLTDIVSQLFRRKAE